MITLATKQSVVFECNYECTIGAYKFSEGEILKAASDRQGRFHLYADWADGSLGTFTAAEINKLAGYQAVQE